MNNQDDRVLKCSNCAFLMLGTCTAGAQRGMKMNPNDWCKTWAPALRAEEVWDSWSSVRANEMLKNDVAPPPPTSLFWK